MVSTAPQVADSTKVNLLIVELIHHSDVLINLVNLLKNSQGIRMLLFVSERVYQEADLHLLDDPEVVIRIMKKKQALDDFFKQNHDVIEASDIIYFNTLEKYFRVFSKYPFNKPIILRIHNVHADFMPWRSLDWQQAGIFNLLSYVLRRVFFQRRWLFKKRLLRRSVGVILPNTTIRQYLLDANVFPEDKILPSVLPFSYLDTINEPHYNKDKVVIAVTGGVDPNRKDFEQFYQALKIAIDRFDCPVELRLLGKPKGQGHELLEKLKSLQSDKFSLDYSLKFIPDKVFKDKIKSVDFLVAPIKTQTLYRVHKEIYGKSKVSGTENDIVVNQKPAIVVDSYIMPDELKTVCETYSDIQDLSDVLVKWVNEKTFKDKQKNFSKLSGYQLKHIVQSTEALLAQLVLNSKSSDKT